MAKRYWLMKTEPESYGISHLEKDGMTAWTGVRNFMARNFMREMRPGDTVFFYHSSCKVPGIYGLAEVACMPFPDPTQFDTKSRYFEPRATKEKPVWELVDVSYKSTLKVPITLAAIRANSNLHTMIILQPRCRLSVTSVTEAEAKELLKHSK